MTPQATRVDAVSGLSVASATVIATKTIPNLVCNENIAMKSRPLMIQPVHELKAFSKEMNPQC